LKACHLCKTLAYPSNANFETILQVDGIGGCPVTVEDAKITYKIWGTSVPKLKGCTVQEINQCKLQSLVKVLQELLQLKQKVCIGIDISLSLGMSSL
jgi:hypothetical protein